MSIVKLEDILVKRSDEIKSNSKGDQHLIEDCKEWVRKSKLLSLHMKYLIKTENNKENKMNTTTLTKLQNLSTKLIYLKRDIIHVEESIIEIEETKSFYLEDEVLIFERLLCSDSEVYADELSRALGIFQSLLESPLYYDGCTTYEGECLLIKRERIDSESGEYCNIKLTNKEEAVQWEDYKETNTYLQVYHSAKPTEKQCEDEVCKLKEDLVRMKEEVVEKENEIKLLLLEY